MYLYVGTCVCVCLYGCDIYKVVYVTLGRVNMFVFVVCVCVFV